MVGRQLRRRWRCPRCGDLGARSRGGPGAAGPSSEWRPTPDLDADTARFDRLLDQAIKSGDLDEQNRLETWLWLDGPAQPEGRVGGPGRSLLLDMNKALLFHRVPEQAGASGIDAWSQLDRVNAPATVACGDLDVPFLIGRSRELAEYLPNGRHRVLAGMAHLPQIEAPAAVAALVGDALTAG